MTNASSGEILLWVALPYLALGIFVVGHVWRWRYDQFGWTSRSTQLQERRLLKWGSPIFHYGTFAAIAGHVIGILIPESWTRAIGIPESAYRWFSAAAGTVAAVLVIGGVVVLAGRRLFVPRVRATTSSIDYVALLLLLAIILTGIHTGDVQVTAEPLDTPPPVGDTTIWEEIVETSVHCPSGQLLVESLDLGPAEELPNLATGGPGWYRLRVRASSAG